MSDCLNTSEGLTPLTELAGTYNGEAGFLYPGSNDIPAAHALELAAAAAQIVRRDTAGNPSSSGSIAFVAAGMSNTRQEFEAFRGIDDPLKASYVLSINGAQTGQDATVFSGSSFWDVIDSRLATQSLTPEQVGCFWLKTAVAAEAGAFPAHAQTLQGYIKTAVQTIATRYPNCKIIIFSSRTYGGYADIPTSPEPWAYEGGFAVKWIIEDQINWATTGDPDLEYGTVPVLAWGPYLWADGLTPRVDDGLIWECDDFESDGTHPGPDAESKVALMLYDFIESTSFMAWFSGVSAITQHSLFGGTITTDAASYDTSSGAWSPATGTWTPTANRLQLVAVLTRGAATPNVPTLTGHGLTYVQITTATFGTLATNLSRLTWFRAMGAAPTNGALTLDFDGQTQTHCTISVMEFGGVNTDGTNGSGAIGQFEEAALDSVNSIDVSLPTGQTESGSAVVAAYGNANGTAYNTDSGWTEVHDIQSSSPLNRLETQYNLSFDQTGTGAMSSGGTTNMAALMLEILPLTEPGEPEGEEPPEETGPGIIIVGTPAGG